MSAWGSFHSVFPATLTVGQVGWQASMGWGGVGQCSSILCWFRSTVTVGPSPSGHGTIEQGKYCSSYPDSFFMFRSPMHKLTRSVPQPVTPYLQEDILRDWEKQVDVD